MTKDIQKLLVTKNWLSAEVNKFHRLQILFWIKQGAQKEKSLYLSPVIYCLFQVLHMLLVLISVFQVRNKKEMLHMKIFF